MIMIHFADVVFCKILTQTSVDYQSHQSSNWFNNFVMLPPISNDLDKKTSINILFDRSFLLGLPGEKRSRIMFCENKIPPGVAYK